MVNLGFIWGLGLGLLLLLAVGIFIKKKIKKEVKVINVERPKEESSGEEIRSEPTTSARVDTTEPRTDKRVDGKEPDGEHEERSRVQAKPVETTEPVEPRSEQHSPATSPPEPFKY